MTAIEIETHLTKLSCAFCGYHNEPYLVNTTGKALCKCDDCGMLYESDVNAVLNYRKICSKMATKGNSKSSLYFTKQENRVRKAIVALGYRDGFDWSHNVRFKNDRSYFYADFYFPHLKLVIEVNPSIWHKLRARKNTEERKLNYFHNNGMRLVIVDDTHLILRGKKLVKAIEKLIEE